MTDLVERLNDDVRQLTKMVEHAKLAGPETGVRVKEPSLLLTDLSEAASELDRMRRELEEARQYAENLAVVLHEKYHADNKQWKPLSGDLIGLLTQIDNMTVGLVHRGEVRKAAFREAAEIAGKLLTAEFTPQEPGFMRGVGYAAQTIFDDLTIAARQDRGGEE